jgi:hypothetical protein
MNELEPLVETSQSRLTRELLRAGQSDEPERDFSERLLRGLGVGVAAGTVGTMASAGSAAAALPGAAATSSGAVSIALAAKWVAVGVVGGGLLAGGAEVAFSPPREPVTQAVTLVSASARTTPPQVSAPVVVPQAAVVEAEPAPEPPPEAAPARPDAAAPASSGAPGAPGALGREVEVIDRARRAMAAGNWQRALRELDAFDRIESTGVLAREAQVLRIEALHRLGQVDRARQLAQQYRAAYPNDTHAARLRALEQSDH